MDNRVPNQRLYDESTPDLPDLLRCENLDAEFDGLEGFLNQKWAQYKSNPAAQAAIAEMLETVQICSTRINEIQKSSGVWFGA